MLSSRQSILWDSQLKQKFIQAFKDSNDHECQEILKIPGVLFGNAYQLIKFFTEQVESSNISEKTFSDFYEKHQHLFKNFWPEFFSAYSDSAQILIFAVKKNYIELIKRFALGNEIVIRVLLREMAEHNVCLASRKLVVENVFLDEGQRARLLARHLSYDIRFYSDASIQNYPEIISILEYMIYLIPIKQNKELRENFFLGRLCSDFELALEKKGFDANLSERYLNLIQLVCNRAYLIPQSIEEIVWIYFRIKNKQRKEEIAGRYFEIINKFPSTQLVIAKKNNDLVEFERLVRDGANHEYVIEYLENLEYLEQEYSFKDAFFLQWKNGDTGKKIFLDKSVSVNGMTLPHKEEVKESFLATEKSSLGRNHLLSKSPKSSEIASKDDVLRRKYFHSCHIS